MEETKATSREVPIVVVSATEPAEKARSAKISIRNYEMAASSLSTWLTTIEAFLKTVNVDELQQLLGERYDRAKTLEECGVHVYMRGTAGKWHSLTSTPKELRGKIFRLSENDYDQLAFLVTGYEGTWRE
eukprot:GHVU01015311.1.p1 GENE.GHVU01015311.1~~GHVU01015311.1.p1  ORF type:complete len:130 (+),score=12.79 GHVU01015311.1:204-593(+)